MPIMKVTFPFEHQQNGWSETYYLTSATYDTAYKSAIKLAEARIKLCGNDVRIPVCKISDDDVPGDGRVHRIEYRAGLKLNENADEVVIPPAYDGDPDMSWTALPITLLSAVGRSGRVFLRGLPDALFVRGNQFQPTGAWNTAYSKWKALLINGWMFKGINVPLFADWKKITDVVANGAQEVTITSEMAAVPPNSRVQIRGVQTDRGVFSGRYRVSFNAAGITKLAKTTGTFFQWNGGGEIRPIFNQYFGIVDTERGRPSERKPGRPFDSPRGRRRTGYKRR